MSKGPTRKPLENWQLEDAARLKALFKERAKESQEKFGQTHGIGTQGAVYQYLSGRIPLNLRVAVKFANGLKAPLEAISPTLAGELNAVRQPAGQYTFERATLLEDFEHLPAWLQEHIARKTGELRRYAESLPTYMRESMRAPPKDPAAYAAWERSIVEDMIRRQSPAHVDKPALSPSTEKRVAFNPSVRPRGKKHTGKARG